MSESPNRFWEIVRYNPHTLRITMASVTIGVETALRTVPTFNGGTETDLSSYITKCDYIINNVAANIKPMVFENILSQLGGEAFQAVRYREFDVWAALKAHLRTIFGATHSINYLQSQLSNIRQRSDEDIRSFAGRTEKYYHELVSALTVGLAGDAAAAVAASHKTGALTAFINSAQPAIRALLRAHDVTTLEKAITIAIEEELDLQHLNRRFNNNNNKNYGKNNTNKIVNIKCNR